MAANVITPTDVVTGLPHPILPYAAPSRYGQSFEDYHHHNFPRRAPELLPQNNTSPHAQPEAYDLEDIASIALRICRGQLLARNVHEAAHQKLLGPDLPTSVDAKYIHVVKACSGLVSRWAIDVRRPDDDLLVYMNDDVFERVTGSKVLCGERAYYDRPANYRRRIIGSFILQYALEQDLSHVSNQVVDEFLDTKLMSRRSEIGNLMLFDALELSLAPVIPIHSRLSLEGMVQPGKKGVRTSIKKFIHPERLPAYYNGLSAKLSAIA